jgi:hypothetical protein
MSYGTSFFDEYKNYLREPLVRNVHNWMFRIFEDTCPKWKHPLNIIDFGCGQCCEYHNHGQFSGYVGLDLDPIRRPSMYQCDYTKINANEIKGFAGFPPYSFVSLFSTECCMSATEKYVFYDKIFQEYDMQTGLVSGFYYKNRIQEEKVQETGGIVSYQTLEDQKDYPRKHFIEMRTYVDVPSKMFGPDVVEVWKLLIRKPSYVD